MEIISRRQLLRTCAVGLGLSLAGCNSDSTTTDTGSPEGETQTRSTQSPATPTDVTPSQIDERVDTQPPGSPDLPWDGRWPAERFDPQNTGADRDGSGVVDGEVYWRLDAGGPAVLSDNSLINIDTRERTTARLTIRNPATAAPRRERELVDYGVNSPPTVHDGTVCLTTFVEVFCFDVSTGELLWRGPDMDGIHAPPAVDEDDVFVVTGGFRETEPHIRAFARTDGEQSWQKDVAGRTSALPAIDSERVYVGTEDGFHAFDRRSGSEVFHQEDVTARFAAPVVAEGTVFAVDDSGESSKIVALDGETGAVRWDEPVGAARTPVVADRSVYVPKPSGIAELDVEDGRERASGSNRGRPVGLVGDVLYTARDGSIHALDASDGLDEHWSITTEEVLVEDVYLHAIIQVTPVSGALFVSAADGFYGIGPR